MENMQTMIPRSRRGRHPLAGEFEGLVLSGKNAGRDHEDDYLSLNKTTGKKKGRGKKRWPEDK